MRRGLWIGLMVAVTIAWALPEVTVAEPSRARVAAALWARDGVSSHARAIVRPGAGAAVEVLCTRDGGEGHCTAATGIKGTAFVVHRVGVKNGASMPCG